jgi:hypothetical protein
VKQASQASRAELEAAFDHICRSPADQGRLELIARRPAEDAREVVDEGVIHPDHGLVGDTWRVRPTSSTPDRSPHPGKLGVLMKAGVADLVARHPDRWCLAGDQLYVDLDLSEANLPAGTRLAIGNGPDAAVLEVSGEPHLGCHKFAGRFGREALRFVNSPVGRQLRLRGMNTRVVSGGTVRVGDTIRKLPR